jgi:glycosyltransferase involved in cell wall biosynthesis
LGFADEVIVVVDSRTTDASPGLARDAGAKVVYHDFAGFAGLKNAGLEAVKSEWALVVDADERVGARLATEIRAALSTQFDAYRIPAINYFYGHQMRWGGWNESHIRLIRTGCARYVGDLHEMFTFIDPGASVGTFAEPLHHFSHSSILDNLHKTASYSDVEARSRVLAGAEPVTSAQLYFVVLREIIRRLIIRQGWRDGVPGTIECLYQPLSLLAVRTRLWEIQQSPSIDELYERLEQSIE